MNTPAPKTTLAYKVKSALSRPHRIIPYFVQTWRNFFINRTSSDQIEAHRRFIEDVGREDPNRAMGSDSEKHWLESGKLQFDFLVAHGIQSNHRVLEVGCGNLRLGWRLIQFLEEGNYVGLEISSKMLDHARQKITGFKLQDKRPYLFLVDDIDYSFLPGESFDCISVYAVFPNSALGSIERVVLALVPLLKPGGFFDFSYYETGGEPHCFQGAYYYHRRADIATIVEKTGLTGTWLGVSWDPQQTRVRLTRT